MKKIFELSRKFIAGELSITENLKYSLIVYPLAAVHIIFFFFFLFLHIPPLIIYNLFSTIVYFYCAVLLRRELYSFVYYISSIEIVINTILTTILLGWDCGFASYLFAVAAAGFYISYTFRRYQIQFPLFFCFLSVLTYFICYSYSQNTAARYPITSPAFLHPLYLFNSFCTFAFITTFSILFMIDVRMCQKKLFEENAMLGKIAGNDALTGLYNRWSMTDILTEAMQGSRPFCLVMCDIDDFKKINDTYGHNCGDEVLKHISKILAESIPADCHVCRWGGEEFLILLNGYDLDSAAKLADRIRQNISASDTCWQEQSIPHTLTMGVAHHHKNQSLDSLVARADTKLYIGKRQGKNTVVI